MRDLYGQVTQRIIESLETGTRPWQKPWTGSSGSISRPLRSNGIAYRGINVLLLWSAALTSGYSNPRWISFKQAADLGGHVRKGERGSPIFFSSNIVQTSTDEATGEASERTRSFLRSYFVFNAEQTAGLPDHFYQKPPQVIDDATRIPHAEHFVTAIGAQITHGGSHAFYAPAVDRIQMPAFVSFNDPAAYYATLTHELVHWTRHKSRLDRNFGPQRYGNHAYAFEELVAELGAAFVCANLQLTPQIREDHAAYIASWLEVLKQDKRAIFTAAAHAQRAADYLHALQPQNTTDPQLALLTA